MLGYNFFAVNFEANLSLTGESIDFYGVNAGN